MKKYLNKSNIISRREALSCFIASLPLFFLSPWKKTKIVQWNGVLSLPKPMNWNEFHNYQGKIMDIESLAALDSEMKAKKSMLLNVAKLNKDKVKFTFIFKTMEDYQYWSRKSAPLLKQKFFNKNNYHTEVKTFFVYV